MELKINDRLEIINADVNPVVVINPNISYAKKGNHTPNFSTSGKAELDIIPLKTVLHQCTTGEWKNCEKGAHSIHAYKSTCKGYKPYEFDGVIFIDLDKFDHYPELSGVQHIIFDRFKDLCNGMPNLLAIKYSPSQNLHFFVHHGEPIKDENEFAKLAKIYLCCLCKVIRNIIGIDLRDYDGVIDTHLCNADQQLNVNDTPVKWNRACCGVKLTKKQLEILNAEYGEYLKFTYKNIAINPTNVISTGTKVVDDKYYICGLNGYNARTAIAATAYVHFKKDYTATEEYLASNYEYTKEWRGQLKSMVQRGTYIGKYNRSIDLRLFEYNNDSIIIPEGKYMSDIINFDQLSGKPLYWNAGTGAGKTEAAKKIATVLNSKIIILQMNKALRDGKSSGIEDITFGNTKWENSVPLDRIHTTIEGFNRNCANINLSEYIVIVDEAHLLQDYCTISGKYENIIRMLGLIKNAKQVIFMSATPKAERKLFDFEMLKFLRFKDQNLNVELHPLKYIGKGSKEAARYTEMLKIIHNTKGKHLIFSNKHQEMWKKYGLKDIDYTWFHSKNIEDTKMQSILKNNKLLTDITLATLYLGVGVEIKNEKEIHIWFDLNEGWDKAFIEQSIGRPRDAENIYLHFFYTYDVELKTGALTPEEIQSVENAFKNLVIDIDGIPTVNLIAAKLTGIYDANFDSYDDADKRKIEILKLGQIINNKDYFTVYDIDLLKRLPYKKFTTKIHDKSILNTDGKERINRNEEQLKLHLCSKRDKWWYSWNVEGSTYDDKLVELEFYWNDKYNANKMLEDCRKVWNGAIDLTIADEYFGSMTLARTILQDVNNYCDIKSGKKTMKDFEGADKTKENIEKSFKRVETAFNKEWLDYRIYRRTLGKRPRPDFLEITCDDMLQDILGLENITIGGEDIEIPYPFKNTCWKDTLKELKPETNKENAKKGGAKKQIIILYNDITKERLEFGSKSECMKRFDVNKAQFARWLKGANVKKLAGWKLETENESK